MSGVIRCRVTVTRITIPNLVGNVVLYGSVLGSGTQILNATPNKRIINNRKDLVTWSVNKIVHTQTNVPIIIRRNVKNHLLPK